MVEFAQMVDKFVSLMKKINKFWQLQSDLILIGGSDLFDANWYLARYPDIARTKTNPRFHYLLYGAFEGRDPGPNFCSRWYLDTYGDVKASGINPLVHYLRYGKEDARDPFRYQCPVCQNLVNEFLPLPVSLTENLQKYGFPFTADETETINVEQYSCPYCGASDRDRLSASYLNKKLQDKAPVLLLDIAPSIPLGKSVDKFGHVTRHTADLLMEGVDLCIDIENMPEINSDVYDVLICSHVLEHVNDDKKALSELYRVLKPGGWAIIMVPINLTIAQIDEDPGVTDVGERWRRFAQDDHVRLYNKRGFIERVEAAGFTLHQFGVDYFGQAVFRQNGITNKSVLYVAEKLDKNSFSKV
jgi:SAM-dependent methyltransferase